MSGPRRLSRHSYYGDGIGLYGGRYTLYVDESQSADYFVAAGILMHKDRVCPVKDACRRVAKRHKWAEGDGEIKFSGMMSKWNKIPHRDRCGRGPIPEILDVISCEQMPFFSMVVDKEKYRRAGMNRYKGEYHYATERVMIAALDYAGGQHSDMGVIRDEGNKKADSGISTSFEITKKDCSGNAIRNLEWFHGFDTGDSKKHPGLQLADFCSGAVADVLGQGRHDCYARIRRLQDTPGNRRGIPSFFPADGPARSEFLREGHMRPCVSGWHAFLGAAGRA